MFDLLRNASIWIDMFLFYPMTCSAFSTCAIFSLPLSYFWKDKWAEFAINLAVIVLLAIFASTYFIPVLAIATDRIIFRLDPSCSTFEKPTRYICLTFNDQRQRLFYITTRRKCDSSDPNRKNASKFYVVSSWIPSFNEFLTTKSVKFHPESSAGTQKVSYTLPEGYAVRAAGPTGGDRQRVSFTTINILTGKYIKDDGYINSSLLKKFDSGWYRVSNCSSELSRWWYRRDFTLGYVSSNYARLPQSVRKFLLEEKRST